MNLMRFERNRPGSLDFYFVLILSQLVKLLYIYAFHRRPGLQKLGHS